MRLGPFGVLRPDKIGKRISRVFPKGLSAGTIVGVPIERADILRLTTTQTSVKLADPLPSFFEIQK